MFRLKCDKCGKGALRVAITVRDKDGARYRKRICEECGELFYTVEKPVSVSEYSAVWTAYCKRSRIKKET